MLNKIAQILKNLSIFQNCLEKKTLFETYVQYVHIITQNWKTNPIPVLDSVEMVIAYLASIFKIIKMPDQ